MKVSKWLSLLLWKTKKQDHLIIVCIDSVDKVDTVIFAIIHVSVGRYYVMTSSSMTVPNRRLRSGLSVAEDQTKFALPTRDWKGSDNKWLQLSQCFFNRSVKTLLFVASSMACGSLREVTVSGPPTYNDHWSHAQTPRTCVHGFDAKMWNSTACGSWYCIYCIYHGMYYIYIMYCIYQPPYCVWWAYPWVIIWPPLVMLSSS